MDEKKTFGEFVKENKGKIIKGTLIVAGVVVAVVAIKLLTNKSEIIDINSIEDLMTDGTIEGLEGTMTQG